MTTTPNSVRRSTLADKTHAVPTPVPAKVLFRNEEEMSQNVIEEREKDNDTDGDGNVDAENGGGEEAVSQ
jgi:hypothetical protein